MDARRYYADLTAQYERYAGAAHGWHYGVWEPDVGSHAQALVRANEILVRGLHLGRAARILDVGFGVGGFAAWAAARYGAEVTGITVVPEHLDLARTLAARYGVLARCRFLLMDMDALSFEPGRFDVVVNQETFCHAADKPAYLEAVRRVLRPGGSWRAVDFAVRRAPQQDWEHHSYRAVCDGFHIPSLWEPSSVRGALAQRGFEAIDVQDLTPRVLATAVRIRRLSALPRLARRLRLDWTFRPRDARRRANERGHVEAAHHYSRGLERGCFQHVFYAARVPADDGRPGETAARCP